MRVATEVVDHDLGPFLGEEQGVLPAEPTTCSGDDGHSAVEASHVISSFG
jgi:hypothetical protein